MSLIELLPLGILVVGTFGVAYFVAAIGPTGGLQLAVTSATLPAGYVIPVHAWISGFSAVFRTAGLRAHISFAFVARFAAPSIAATAIAVLIGSVAGFDWLKILIGLYIVANATGWFSQAFETPRFLNKSGPFVYGALTGFITAFIGASGPLLWALMKEAFESKEALSGTHAACLVIQHLSKIVLFGLFGLSILKFWPLLIATMGASALGTYLGQRRLRAFSEQTYRRLLRIALILSGSLVAALGVRSVFFISG